MSEISVEELAQWRASRRDFLLLDVREPVELTMAKIDGAVHIPLRELQTRVRELDPQSEIAVLCHHGHRSAAVAEYLRATGFQRVHNVDGGIAAYARRVDPSVGEY